MQYLPSKLGRVWLFLGMSLGLRPRDIPRKSQTLPRLDGRYIPFFLIYPSYHHTYSVNCNTQTMENFHTLTSMQHTAWCISLHFTPIIRENHSIFLYIPCCGGRKVFPSPTGRDGKTFRPSLWGTERISVPPCGGWKGFPSLPVGDGKLFRPYLWGTESSFFLFERRIDEKECNTSHPSS